MTDVGSFLYSATVEGAIVLDDVVATDVELASESSGGGG